MTFKEKIMRDNPNNVDEAYDGGVYGCPHHYGYEKGPCPYETPLYGECVECWNRTIPGTENDILKGEKKMEVTRKTKKELLEEIAELKKEVKDLQDREECDKCTKAMKMQYDALVDAGFDSDNALKILNNMIKAFGGIK